MNSLRDIRRQLRSIENIKKITDAMERVAASRLKKAQSRAEDARPYAKKMREMIENLSTADVSHPLFNKREAKKIGVVIVTGDRGLSGPYNANILQKAERFLRNYSPEQVELYLFGKKSIDYFQRKKWPVAYQRTDWGGKISFHELHQFSYTLTNAFLNEALDEVWLIYTHYINVMQGKVVVEKFLNIEKTTLHPHASKDFLSYIFEPSPEEIFKALIPRYCVTLIQTVINESYAAELAARIMAMRSASKNSEEVIEKMTRVRNKIRQASITKEMIEITTGAEGIK